MSPNVEHARHVLPLFLNKNKNESESQRIHLETCGDNFPNACVNLFTRFKRGDFDIKDKDRPRQPKKIEDAALQELLDEDGMQTEQQMTFDFSRRTICDHLQAMRNIQKAGKWIPHQLNDR